LKCSYCGSENPDDKKFCGDCGSPLKTEESPRISWQKRLARQTAYIIILISILLIIIGFGFKDQADAIPSFEALLGIALINIAWLFGLLGIAGFLVAGLAYLFSLPIPVKKKQEAKPDTLEERKEGEGKVD